MVLLQQSADPVTTQLRESTLRSTIRLLLTSKLCQARELTSSKQLHAVVQLSRHELLVVFLVFWLLQYTAWENRQRNTEAQREKKGERKNAQETPASTQHHSSLTADGDLRVAGRNQLQDFG